MTEMIRSSEADFLEGSNSNHQQYGLQSTLMNPIGENFGSIGEANGALVARIKGKKKDKQRVCIQCGTTDTPLWRYGPSGPKSMCNACGIRWKRRNSSNAKRKKVTPLTHAHKLIEKATASAPKHSFSMALPADIMSGSSSLPSSPPSIMPHEIPLEYNYSSAPSSPLSGNTSAAASSASESNTTYFIEEQEGGLVPNDTSGFGDQEGGDADYIPHARPLNHTPKRKTSERQKVKLAKRARAERENVYSYSTSTSNFNNYGAQTYSSSGYHNKDIASDAENKFLEVANFEYERLIMFENYTNQLKRMENDLDSMKQELNNKDKLITSLVSQNQQQQSELDKERDNNRKTQETMMEQQKQLLQQQQQIQELQLQMQRHFGSTTQTATNGYATMNGHTNGVPNGKHTQGPAPERPGIEFLHAADKMAKGLRMIE